MQSLQMRWPVPGSIGLSMHTSANAPTASPARLTRCISEIFSSSGQPLSSTPSALGFTWLVLLSRRPLEQESLSRSWQYRQ